MSTLAMHSPPSGTGPGQTHHDFLPRSGGPRSAPLYVRRGTNPFGSAGSTSSLSSDDGFGDDEDAITPCPPQHHMHPHVQNSHAEQQQQQQQQTTHTRPVLQTKRQGSTDSSSSWRDSQVITESHSENENVDTETLWRRMLAIQRLFGCYNSARMRAALEMGEESGFIPSKTGLDLLNDSIDQLPDESRRRLEEYLEHGDERAILSTSSSRRKSWRERLLYMPGLH
ncbi:hypothetical protein QBC47DRAFT_366534 [Echria macrotheca]|uniref:Uncharacterized protein n=1 Tax=Echria macrotheca TaxID=438768 RepID=A0AAJ0FAI9_9PEZI|nr:hypothetical protein QBC47DRAFT_366534 [Echria macrotheca]